MKSTLFAGVIAAAILLAPAPAEAGPFTDELSRCLVRNTNNDDRTLLIKWIYVAMSQHPQVNALTTVSDAEADDVSRRTGELFMDLITKRCVTEAKDAIQYDGEVAFQQSFSVLGQVAMQGIMADPGVAVYMGSLEKHLDEERLNEVFGQ